MRRYLAGNLPAQNDAQFWRNYPGVPGIRRQALIERAVRIGEINEFIAVPGVSLDFGQLLSGRGMHVTPAGASPNDYGINTFQAKVRFNFPQGGVQYRNIRDTLPTVATLGNVADLAAAIISYLSAKYPGADVRLIGSVEIVY